jgi:signal transduction histidine kinase
LAGIRTTAEILRGRLHDDPDLAQFVDVIVEETARLDRIVGSLLQFAKPPAPRLSPVDVPGLLDRAARLAAGRAAEQRVRLRVEVQAVQSPMGDADQLLQVLLNLLLNAIDASPEGGEVLLQVAACPEGVRVTVEDRGPGMTAALRERIFDPFFTTKPGGTGLGLSISQNIVSRHGGTLRVEGTEAGTRASVTLPPPGRERTSGGEARWRTS